MIPEKGVMQRGVGENNAHATINVKCEGPNQRRGYTSQEADAIRPRKRNTDLTAWVGSAYISCFRGYAEKLLAPRQCMANIKINICNIIYSKRCFYS